MAERALPVRKRRFGKGREIRLSTLVFDALDAERRRGVKADKLRSWDSFMRRFLGLPDRVGRTQPLIEGMLETTTGIFILRMNDVPWSELEQTTFRLADAVARRKKMRTPSTPIKMRQIR